MTMIQFAEMTNIHNCLKKTLFVSFDKVGDILYYKRSRAPLKYVKRVLQNACTVSISSMT